MGVDPIHFNSITELELLQKFVLFAEDELEFHDRAVVYPSSDENRLFWGDNSSAQSEFGYLPTGGLDFESGQRLVAFNYQCDVYCEEQSCGTPETVIFRITDQ